MKSRRDMFGERLKAKYPDKEYANDEALFAQINDDYDNYENEIGRYKEREDKMTDMFVRDPKSARFMAAMAKDEDPVVLMLELVGADGITDLMNNPEKKEEYAKANADYLKRVAREQELEAVYNKNLGETLAMLEQVQQEQGLSDETVDAAVELIQKIADDAVLAKYSRETFDMALKMLRRDADIENARSEGEIAGRNAKIDEKLKKEKSGDGLPGTGGANAAAPTQTPRRKTVLEMARDEEKGNW